MATRLSMDEKKKILNCHLPFVNRMITKATGTKFEAKWNNMKNSIVLEHQLANMSGNQVHLLNSRLLELRKKVNFKDNKDQVPATSSKESHAKERETSEASTSSAQGKSNNSKEELEDEEKGMDFNQVLNSLKSSDEDPEKALQGLENALGRENLLKFQNLLVKNALKKNLGTATSSDNKEDEVTSSNDTNPTKVEVKSPQKRTPKRKLNELDRLHRDIEEMYDCEDIFLKSLHPRTCTKPKLTDEMYHEKFELKKLRINVMRLNLTRKDMPIIVNDSTTELELINTRLLELKKRKIEVIHEVKKVEPKASPKNIAKKRLRSSWSKGLIKKAKRPKVNTSDEWKDVESPEEKPFEYSFKMPDFIKKMNYVCTKVEGSKELEVPKVEKPTEKLMESEDSLMYSDEESMDDLLEELPSKEPEPEIVNKPPVVPIKIEEKSAPIILQARPKSDVAIQSFVKVMPSSFLMPFNAGKKDEKSSLVITKTKPGEAPRTFVQLTVPSSSSSNAASSSSSSQLRVFKFNEIKRVQPIPRKTPEKSPPAPSVEVPKPVVSEPLNVIRSITIPSKSLKQLTMKPILKVDSSKELPAVVAPKLSTPEPPPAIVPSTQQQGKLFIKSVASLNASVDAANTNQVAPEKPESPSYPLLRYKTPMVPQDEQPAEEIVEILRPWLKDNVKPYKTRSTSEKMLNKFCLAALFKCMDRNCHFYTNNKYFFQIHIDLHLKHQPIESKTCFSCAYCPHQASTGINLIKHVEVEHQYDLYSCSYCFYRTFNEYQLFLNHQPKFHPDKEHEAINLHQALTKSPKSDLIFIKNCLGQYVSPFSCISCKKKIYVLEAYNEHLQTHRETVITKCLFCLKQTNPMNIFEHYFNCYGFGMFQCVYCEFGTSSLQFIDDHLSTFHPSRCPYFCERLLSTAAKNSVGQDMSSLETLTIKLMSKRVDGGTKIVVNDKQSLSNAQNIGRISDDVVIGHGMVKGIGS